MDCGGVWWSVVECGGLWWSVQTYIQTNKHTHTFRSGEELKDIGVRVGGRGV